MPLMVKLQEKPSTQNGAGDISPLPSSSITDRPDSPANRELLKQKDMLTQRDNEISILVSMLKKEKQRIQEANVQLAKFSQSSLLSSSGTHDEKGLQFDTSHDCRHVKCKQNVSKGIPPVLDAKQHVCARRDKSSLESRFINTNKGYGVFATSPIEEGSFIVEYRGVLQKAGECIPDAYSYYFIYDNTRYCINASVDDGSLGRLVNDDSNPNAKVKLISVNCIPHLCLFALRDIQPGEEITYDYGGYDLPWRRGTWLCLQNSSQPDNKTEDCEETPSESETTEQEKCSEEVPMRADKATQTEHEECKEEVPKPADKATQTTEQDAFVEQITWKYNPCHCLTSECQKICENPLLQNQLTPVTQQALFNEEKSSSDDPTTCGQPMSYEEQTATDEEPSESQLTFQMTDEVGRVECREDGEQEQTNMDLNLCVEEHSCPVSAAQLPCVNEKNNQPFCNDESPAVNEQLMSDGELTSGNEASESHLTNQQILEQQTSMEAEPCVEEQSGPEPAAQSICEEEHPTCQNEPCQKQPEEQSPEADQDSDLSNEDSNDEVVSSDEEFLPDSDTESDDDSDMEKPKKRAKTSVTCPQSPSVLCQETEEQAIPPVQNNVVTQATKLDFCFVCGKACTKIVRHLKLHRKDNAEIKAAFKLRKNSKQRARFFEVLKKRGNHQHNKSVNINDTGLIEVKRKPKHDIDPQKFEYCMYCKRLYMHKELWKHVRRCASNPERDISKTSKAVLCSTALSQCPHLQHLSEDVKKMLCDMHQDEIALIVRNDEYILKLAQSFYDINGSSKENHVFVRQTIRCVGRFVFLLRNKYQIRNLAEVIKPSNFSRIIEAIKELAEFNEEKTRFTIPSLARRIGLALRKYCILSTKKALAVHDRKLIKATGTFMDLFKNAHTHFALSEVKYTTIESKAFLLPFVNDVRIFHCYLEETAQCAMKALRETPSAQCYADLCKVTLAQILIFNRRHGEVSQLTIKRFQAREQLQSPDFFEELTEFEKTFCKRYCRILVRQKIGALVPIILTPDMIDALVLLTEMREQCSVPKSNMYVFGQPRSKVCYRGENALRICANECGATNPDKLTSTKFSRHISILCQVLTLKNHELKLLAEFIGHDISLCKEYYRQPEAMPRLAKLCKLILTIEKGRASDMLGQSLDDIVVPDEIMESESEDEYFEDDIVLKDLEAQREFALRTRFKKQEKEKEKRNQIIPAPEPMEEQDIPSTTIVQNKESTTEKPEAEQQPKVIKKIAWTKEEKSAIMKHFKKHICNGRLATVKESRRCQLMEQPVLNGRSVQNIRDFVRNAGTSFRRKMKP